MTRRALPFAVVLLGVVLPAGVPAEAPPADEPRDSGLVERAEARIAQVYVSISGPAEALAEITAGDLRLFVSGDEIEQFTLDRLWAPVGPGGAAELTQQASYVFYYDQPMLSPVGWQRAVEVSRGLIPRLIGHGGRGMVVSSGRQLKVYADWTDDAEVLLVALDRMWGALDQRGNPVMDREVGLDLVSTSMRWSEEAAAIPDAAPPSHARATGIEDLSGMFAQTYVDTAQLQATAFYLATFQDALGDLQRLRAFLTRLYETAPPKSVVYFADMLETEPGEHFLSAAGMEDAGCSTKALCESQRGHYAEFDGLVDDAATHGIRFYSIFARPLQHETPEGVWDAMTYLGRETGGRPLLRGETAADIGEAIETDQSSLYLLGFDPQGLPRDEPLAVHVEPRIRGVKIRPRGRFLVRSRATEIEGQLLASMVNATGEGDRFPLQLNLVPVGLHKRSLDVLLQVTARAPGVGTVDLGVSLVHDGKVRHEDSRRFTISGGSMPVALETMLEIPPGPFELVAVAHRLEDDLVASRTARGFWPDTAKVPATIGPIAIVQPARAAIARGEELRRLGSLARGEGDPIDAAEPATFVSLVCRGTRLEGALLVERELVGADSVPFEPIEIGPGGDPCSVVRDIVRPDTFTAGRFRYVMRLTCGGEECASAERVFRVPPSPGR